MSISTTGVDQYTIRHWPLEGTQNLRDVGGYATTDGTCTRWGVLLRSDSLHRLPLESQGRLIYFGIRTVIDLRTEMETATAPDVFARSDRVAYIHLPMLAPHIVELHRAESLEELNRLLVDRCQNQVALIASLLAEEHRTPALVHCSAGKDRTGLVIACLLNLVGVERATIVEDYLQNLSQDLRSAAAQIGFDLERLDRMLECRGDVMERTLRYIDQQYGGTAEYVRSAGVDQETIARLRSVLVHEA